MAEDFAQQKAAVQAAVKAIGAIDTSKLEKPRVAKAELTRLQALVSKMVGVDGKPDPHRVAEAHDLIQKDIDTFRSVSDKTSAKTAKQKAAEAGYDKARRAAADELEKIETNLNKVKGLRDLEVVKLGSVKDGVEYAQEVAADMAGSLTAKELPRAPKPHQSRLDLEESVREMEKRAGAMLDANGKPVKEEVQKFHESVDATIAAATTLKELKKDKKSTDVMNPALDKMIKKLETMEKKLNGLPELKREGKKPETRQGADLGLGQAEALAALVDPGHFVTLAPGQHVEDIMAQPGGKKGGELAV